MHLDERVQLIHAHVTLQHTATHCNTLQHTDSCTCMSRHVWVSFHDYTCVYVYVWHVESNRLMYLNERVQLTHAHVWHDKLSALQCCALCCSILQRVAVYCTVKSRGDSCTYVIRRVNAFFWFLMRYHTLFSPTSMWYRHINTLCVLFVFLTRYQNFFFNRLLFDVRPMYACKETCQRDVSKETWLLSYRSIVIWLRYSRRALASKTIKRDIFMRKETCKRYL